jgi:glycosyltransferase involved in cell wall biosynthesis
MIHEKFSYLMRNADLTISAKAEAIKRADWIICISESTKQDLIEILNVNPEKISVIYLSYSTINQTSFQSTPVVTEPYILYTGLRGSYKNFDRLLKAYASNSQLRKTHKIVCFGDKSFSQQEIDTMVNLELDPHQVLHYFGSDSLLANFYTHADALVYPSLYEGFGIPPLEAMSFNCPVICSNTSSIPEVVGDAGEYFDPYDIDSISDALEKVIFSTSRSEELVSRGQKRVKLFSWHKCAKETMEVYNSLA